MNNYRFDSRSKEEFERDIKSHTMEERALFLLWLDLIEKKTGTRPKFEDTGCGKDGKFLEDKKVTTSPDFKVEGYGLIEVKFAKPMLDRFFHLKENQVKSYYREGAIVLMVNGAGEDIPTFTMLNSAALKKIMRNCKIIPWKGFGNKPSYRIAVKDYLWHPLKHPKN